MQARLGLKSVFVILFSLVILTWANAVYALDLVQGKAKTVTLPGPVSEVLVADPSIVDVGAVRADQLYVIGAGLGDTNILLFDKAGALMDTLDVHVRVDEASLKNTLKRLFPKEKIQVKTVNNDVMVSGPVSSPATANAIRDVAARFAGGDEGIVNMMQITGEQQVMIKVKVVEVSRSILNELGLDTDLASPIANGEVTAGLTTTDSLGLSVDPSFGIGSLVYDNGGVGPLSFVVRALERDGLVNTLAEPNLTAVSGENARFLAGGEFPIPSQRDSDGNVVYEYKPFGVSLAFKPVVLSDDRISLQVATEVSEVSFEQTLQLPGVTVPSFSVRRAETTVEMASGGSLMMAGLIESQAADTLNELPGIKNIPVIGRLVSSESFTRNESELLVMITAYLVQPFADKEQIVETPLRVKQTRPDPIAEMLAAHLSDKFGDNLPDLRGTEYGFILE